MEHSEKTQQGKSFFSTENGLRLPRYVLCLQQRNNPINGKPIRANPEVVHGL